MLFCKRWDFFPCSWAWRPLLAPSRCAGRPAQASALLLPVKIKWRCRWGHPASGPGIFQKAWYSLACLLAINAALATGVLLKLGSKELELCFTQDPGAVSLGFWGAAGQGATGEFPLCTFALRCGFCRGLCCDALTLALRPQEGQSLSAFLWLLSCLVPNKGRLVKSLFLWFYSVHMHQNPMTSLLAHWPKLPVNQMCEASKARSERLGFLWSAQ